MLLPAVLVLLVLLGCRLAATRTLPGLSSRYRRGISIMTADSKPPPWRIHLCLVAAQVFFGVSRRVVATHRAALFHACQERACQEHACPG